ncbi:alpha/beta hydrolase family esterase [Aestuariivirga sp.]|uniref:extracellular catalytic domain type 1 short-chain-length polyhydroxyalkanoate depolymerase n=1 Tax=Aestuariivirga sp. TaxID=2650926 RepID=UPI00391DCCA0
MFDQLSPAMRRALAAARRSNPMEATRVLQEALGVVPVRPPYRHSTVVNGGQESPEGGIPKLRCLADTLTDLRSTRDVSQLRRSRRLVLPEGSAFLQRTIQTSSGGRDFRLFVPSTHRPRGLVVMLHGCKQNAEDFALGTCMNFAADAEGLLVAYPTQARSANAMGCWNWFRPEDQRRDEGEPLILAELTRSLVLEYALGSKVFIAGLSAGGAMAAVMGANYPDLYDAIGVHSGLPCYSAHDVNSAFAAMRGDHQSGQSNASLPATATRLIVFHGSHDRTVAPSNGERLVNSLRWSNPSARVNERHFTSRQRAVKFTEIVEPDGKLSGEAWFVEGASHHWIGGDPAGSFAKAEGPSASTEMVRFFLGRRRS